MTHPNGCNCHICVNVHGIRVDPTKLGYALGAAIGASFTTIPERRYVDEVTIAELSKRNKELTEALEGARESFENIAERLGPDTVHGGCKCRPGFMCVFCEAREAANAMAYTLEGRRVEIGEDSPADIELARKAFGELAKMERETKP